MSISLYDVSVGTYLQVLQGVSGVLDKGAAFCAEKNIGLDDVIQMKLADDMFTLHWQVVATVHQSKGAVDALRSGKFAPPNFDQEFDYSGLQGLVQDAIGELKSEDKAKVDGLADGQVVFSLGGNDIPFTAENFILSFSLPNFYFHATTTYDILRAQGAPLGKRDFLGPLRIGV